MNFIYLVILSIVTLLFFTTNQVADGHQPHDTKIISPCPEANSNTKGVLKEFLTISEWSSARQETNTDNIDTSQITLLQDSEDSSICKEFNNQYEEALSEEWDSGGKTYDVTYYKAGNFYFVIILLKKPNDPDVAASGVDYLDVYDDNRNLIKGYAF